MRRIQFVTSLLFVLLVSFPAVEYWAHLTESFQLGDAKPDFPKKSVIRGLYEDNDNVRRTLETFFNRMFPGRDFLVELWNTFTVEVLRDHEKVYIGNDGWLFLKAYINNHLGRERDILKNRAVVIASFDKLSKTLDLLDIDMVLLVPPYKTRVYPEHFQGLPVSLVEDSVGNDIILSAATGKRRIHVVDVKRELENAKEEFQVYYRGDTHWTLAFGLIANDIVVERISLIASRPVPERKYVKSDEMVPAPMRTEFNFSQGIHPRFEYQPKLFRAVGSDTKNLSDYRHWSYTNPKISTLPGLVVLGDSFFQQFFDKESLLDEFSSTTFYNNDNNAYLATNKSRIPEGTKFILLEMFEQNTDKLVNPVWWNDIMSLIDPDNVTQWH